VLTDAAGIPLAVTLTGANAHDVTQLLPLVDAVPAVAGKPGRPRRRVAKVQGDRAYGSRAHEQQLRRRGMEPELGHRFTEHGSGLGKTRWVVERTIAWLHQQRRLRVRFERRADIHDAFLKLGCAMICWKHVLRFC
jgi:transposase